MTAEHIPAAMIATCGLCREPKHRHSLLEHRLTARWGNFSRSYCERCRARLDMLADALLADTESRYELARKVSQALEGIAR